MEYLKNVHEKSKTINEDDLVFFNIFDRPDIFYGNPLISYGNQIGFRKYNILTEREIEAYSDDAKREYANLSLNVSGCFLRFKNSSGRLIIKFELKRKWDLLRMPLWNSSGFDVYEVQNGEYIHRTVFAPQSGENIGCEEIKHNPKNEVVIYLPLYNEIINLYIGSKGKIEAVDTVKRPAVAFYGNSITQGASASRSGNCFVNIFSRLTNTEVYNYSVSSCCRGLKSVAQTLGTLNLKAIVIDYSRNAENVLALKQSHEQFYKEVRKYHEHIPIVIMTVSNFREITNVFNYNSPIFSTYQNALKNNENTIFFDQMGLFGLDEYDLCSFDGTHYTDYGMYRIAENLAEILELKESTDEKQKS